MPDRLGYRTRGHCEMTRHSLHLRLIGPIFIATTIAGYSPSVAAQPPLGRLFFTPEQRQTLDQQRQFNIQEKQVIPQDETLTINGVVTRSSGKRTVWINGAAQNELDTQTGASVVSDRTAPGKVIIQFNGDQATRANIGDTVNHTTGESTSLLVNGRIKVYSRPSSAK